MMRHSTDPNVFIRSLASRGHLGGLALGAKGVVRVMGLIGCDVVIVETVGVGQSEVEIAKNADLVVVVLAPGQGDSVQMLKAGLMEAGDLFVINKADRPESAQLYQQLLSTLQTSYMAQMDLANAAIAVSCHSDGALTSTGAPPVMLTSATNHEGIGQLADELERITARNSGHWRAEREHQALEEIRQAVLEEVRHRVCDVIGANGTAHARTQPILDGSITLEELVDELLQESVTRHVRNK
jgi:LAO/AO transport system kinase